MSFRANFSDIVKHNSRQTWALDGTNRLVKVIPRWSSVNERIGYVTQEKYLLGLTPLAIERNLGLRQKMLAGGAKVYSLQRLPVNDEYEFRLSTAFPGGEIFQLPDLQSREFKERDFWPPGKKGVPQWEVNAIIPTRLIRLLLPYEPY